MQQNTKHTQSTVNECAPRQRPISPMPPQPLHTRRGILSDNDYLVLAGKALLQQDALWYEGIMQATDRQTSRVDTELRELACELRSFKERIDYDDVTKTTIRAALENELERVWNELNRKNKRKQSTNSVLARCKQYETERGMTRPKLHSEVAKEQADGEDVPF